MPLTKEQKERLTVFDLKRKAGALSDGEQLAYQETIIHAGFGRLLREYGWARKELPEGFSGRAAVTITRMHRQGAILSFLDTLTKSKDEHPEMSWELLIGTAVHQLFASEDTLIKDVEALRVEMVSLFDALKEKKDAP